MSAGYDESLNDLDVRPPTTITLAVGWTTGKNTRIRQVLLGSDVSSEFRRVAKNTLDDIKEREPAEWTPDADLSPETFLVLDAEDVGEAPKLTSDHDGKKFLQVLSHAESLDAIHPQHLPTGDVSFYAIVLGEPDDRTVFIRRSNPRRGLKRGRIYSLLGDTLQSVEKPIFAFDEWFDLVLHRDKILILSQTVFAAFFRDQETLAKKIPEWIEQLAAHVPLADTSRNCLTERVSRDSRLKARLEAIVRRDHLASVAPETLRTAMEDNELDPSRLLDEEGNLTLTTEDIPQVLYLLNEDLFTGSLTSTGFRADRKATR